MSVIKRTSAAKGIGRPFLFEQHALSRMHGAAVQRGFGAEPQNVDDQVADDPVETLNARLAQMTEQLAAEKARLVEVRAEAKAEGFAEGQLAAEQREQERIDLLAAAAHEASAQVSRSVEASRDLAIEIARATVAAILGQSDDHAALVSATACKWAEELKSSAIIRLRVSGHDFAAPVDVAKLEAALNGVRVTAQHDLPHGACVFDLELGQLDASIPGQAARADEFLRKHAAGEGGAA